MRRLTQVLFYMSVVALTIAFILPVGGADWNEVVPFGIAWLAPLVILLWVLSSGFRARPDRPSGGFGPPRVRWWPFSAWCVAVGIVAVGLAAAKLDNAGSRFSGLSYGSEQSREADQNYVRSVSDDARLGQIIGGVTLALGIAGGLIATIAAQNRRRKVRLEL